MPIKRRYKMGGQGQKWSFSTSCQIQGTRHPLAPADGRLKEEGVAVAVAWHSLVPGAGIVFVRISAAVLQCRVLIDGSTEH